MPRPRIELDELLNGTPSSEDVADFFENGEFDQEYYLVAAIKRHLQTEEQRQTMFDGRFSIEDILNGRVEGEQNYEAASRILDEWNAKLGFQHFGY